MFTKKSKPQPQQKKKSQQYVSANLGADSAAKTNYNAKNERWTPPPASKLDSNKPVKEESHLEEHLNRRADELHAQDALQKKRSVEHTGSLNSTWM